MARKYAQIQVAIWSDEDFKALAPAAQHMFFVLLSQPRVNLCGVLDYLPHRLAGCSHQMTTDDVEHLIKTLRDERYVVIDFDTSELLIRSFVRNDGLLKMPNVAKGMASDFGEVMSQKLRNTIEYELSKTYKREPDLAGWEAIRQTNPVLHRRVMEGVSK